MSKLPYGDMELKITKELLIYLRAEYSALFKPYGASNFRPVVGEVDDLASKISITPFKEDELIPLDDALNEWDVFDLEGEPIEVPD